MKKGISLVVLVLTIVVMIILAGVVIMNIGNTFVNTDLSKFKSDVSQLQNLMSIYKIRKSGYLDFETVQFDTSSLNYGELEQFEGEDIIDNKIKLYVIDLNAIDSEGVNFGNLQNGLTDRYLYSLTTGKVYYEQGFQYDNCKIYTETNNMPSYTVASSIQVGDFIEYKVAYTDMFEESNAYSYLNGWRLLSYTKNADGTYSNVKIISTGSPVRINIISNDNSTNKSWWITDEQKLEEFKELLLEQSDGYFGFYNGDNTYYGLQIAAGLYYNFKDIKFKYSENQRGNNLGYFKNINLNGVIFNSTSNNQVEKTGSEIFNLFEITKAEVRLTTLPELTTVIGRTGKTTVSGAISSNEDPLGLVKLSNLTSVPNMENFTQYTSENEYTMCYYVASPWSNQKSLFHVYTSGTLNNWGLQNGEVRPAICIKSGVNVKFVDTNNNGVPEIVVAN